jgi:hypothetical protein
MALLVGAVQATESISYREEYFNSQYCFNDSFVVAANVRWGYGSDGEREYFDAMYQMDENGERTVLVDSDSYFAPVQSPEADNIFLMNVRSKRRYPLWIREEGLFPTGEGRYIMYGHNGFYLFNKTRKHWREIAEIEYGGSFVSWAWPNYDNRSILALIYECGPGIYEVRADTINTGGKARLFFWGEPDLCTFSSVIKIDSCLLALKNENGVTSVIGLRPLDNGNRCDRAVILDCSKEGLGDGPIEERFKGLLGKAYTPEYASEFKQIMSSDCWLRAAIPWDSLNSAGLTPTPTAFRPLVSEDGLRVFCAISDGKLIIADSNRCQAKQATADSITGQPFLKGSEEIVLPQSQKATLYNVNTGKAERLPIECLSGEYAAHQEAIFFIGKRDSMVYKYTVRGKSKARVTDVRSVYDIHMSPSGRHMLFAAKSKKGKLGQQLYCHDFDGGRTALIPAPADNQRPMIYGSLWISDTSFAYIYGARDCLAKLAIKHIRDVKVTVKEMAVDGESMGEECYMSITIDKQRKHLRIGQQVFDL